MIFTILEVAIQVIKENDSNMKLSVTIILFLNLVA